jgi:hypothetical protein
LILIVCPLTPITFIWKDAVWMVWALSVLALALGMWGVLSAETPVEPER